MESQKETDLNSKPKVKVESDTDNISKLNDIDNILPKTKITLSTKNPSPMSAREKLTKYIDDTKDHVYIVTHHIVHHRVEIPNVVVPRNPAVTTLPSRLTFRQKIKHQIRRALERLFSRFRQFEDIVEEKIHSASGAITDDVKDSVDQTEEKFSDAVHSATDKMASQYEILKDDVVNAFEKIKDIIGESKTNESENNNQNFQFAREKFFKTAKERVGNIANAIENTLTSRFTPSEDTSYTSHRLPNNDQPTTSHQIDNFASNGKGFNEKEQTVNYSIDTSALYCAIFVLYFLYLRINLWQQRRRTAVFVGDGSIEMLKSMQNQVGTPSVISESDDMSIPNGQSTQQRMNSISGNQATTSKSNQHRSFYQAPSPCEYEMLMRLCEACNFYTITVPVGVLLLSILEINGLPNTILHVLYIILGYSALLYIHGGLFGHSQEFVLGRKEVAQQIGWIALAVASFSCGWLALSSFWIYKGEI